jgi:acyl-CoA synthetase (AMP-forming)/AMP-acid ligase II
MGHWRDRSIIDHLDEWARANPSATAVFDAGGKMSIGEIHEQSRRLASSLADFGVEHGDRVLVQLPNQVEAFVAVLAVARLGAITVFAQTALREAELTASLQQTDAVAIVTVDNHRGFAHGAAAVSLMDNVPSVRGVVVAGDASPGAVAYEEAMTASTHNGIGAGPDEPFGIIFTSGTTALPKGCVHTSNTLLFSVRGTSKALGVGSSTGVMFMPSPVMHSTGLVVGFLSPLYNRIPTVLQAQWDPELALDLIGQHRCTVTLGATTFGTMMLNVFDGSRHDVSSFATFALAGSPIPSDVVSAIETTFGCRVVSAYGSTEALVVTTSRPNDTVEKVAVTDGAPVDGVECDIVDDDRQPVPTGVEGEVRIKAPGRFLTYWNDDNRMRQSVDNEHRLYSGDLGRLDADGYLRITGRKADVIIRGGVNIAAAAVEAILLRHPSIADVAVVAMPDERLGERACAFILPIGDLPINLRSVTQFLADARVAKFNWPERVEVVDVLPRTATGKIEKWQLRQEISRKLQAERVVVTQP